MSAKSATEPRAHPREEKLAALVAGQLDLAARVVLEAHLAYCRACTEAVADFSSAGALHLRSLSPAPPPASVWAALDAAIGDEGKERIDGRLLVEGLVVEERSLPLPPAALVELPYSAASWSWRRLPFSRARSLRLVPCAAGEAELLLAEVPAGTAFPAHTHLGIEEVVVLQGAYRDPEGTFRAGDYQLYPEGSTHAPRVDPGSPGWVVARLEGRVRFTGIRGLAVALWRRTRALRRTVASKPST